MIFFKIVLKILRMILGVPVVLIGLLFLIFGMVTFKFGELIAGMTLQTTNVNIEVDDECLDLECEDCEHKNVCLDERVDVE